MREHLQEMKGFLRDGIDHTRESWRIYLWIGIPLAVLMEGVVVAAYFLKPREFSPPTPRHLVAVLAGVAAGCTFAVFLRVTKAITGASLMALLSLPLIPFLAAANVLGVLFAGAREVITEEGEGTATFVCESLQLGRLRPSDEVWSGRGWVALSDTPQFYESCLDAERRAKIRHFGTTSGCLFLALGLAAGLFWLFARLGRMLFAD